MNLFAYTIPQTSEISDQLCSHKNVTINRIVSARGFRSELYVQEEDEWVALLKGEATLLLNEETKRLKEGDTLFIPAGQPHQVLQTSEGALWLTVHIR
jgi:cupin 2 domain-containing protein